MDNRERQLAELLLLESMYPDEFEWQTSSRTTPSLEDLESTDPSATLRMQAFTLEVSLPPDYPEQAKPHAYLHCAAEVDTATRKHARKLLADEVAALVTGMESLDLLVSALTCGLADLTADTMSQEAPTKPTANTASKPALIRRLLFWSHHLLATSKRRDIIAWSRELTLGGFSRPGYPGAILIEGEAHNVAEFETRIKALRWQALQVRGEDDGATRLLGTGINGVSEVEELSDIVKSLRAIDNELADWFLAGMRIGHG